MMMMMTVDKVSTTKTLNNVRYYAYQTKIITGTNSKNNPLFSSPSHIFSSSVFEICIQNTSPCCNHNHRSSKVCVSSYSF